MNWDDPGAHRIAQEVVAQGKVLAAICIAPVTLARAGRPRCSNRKPARCRRVDSPGAARQFGETIAAALKKQG